MLPTERFRPPVQQERFLEALGAPGEDGRAKGRIGVDIGSISLCHVTAGFTDVTMEIARGFAVWDLSPGLYVVHAAGASPSTLTATNCGLNTRLAIKETFGPATQVHRYKERRNR